MELGWIIFITVVIVVYLMFMYRVVTQSNKQRKKAENTFDKKINTMEYNKRVEITKRNYRIAEEKLEERVKVFNKQQEDKLKRLTECMLNKYCPVMSGLCIEECINFIGGTLGEQEFYQTVYDAFPERVGIRDRVYKEVKVCLEPKCRLWDQPIIDIKRG